MAKDKAGIQMAEMKVQSYEEAFNRIKAATGITDIDQLVTTFIQNEEQNFSLFNFVNEQNNDVEKLEEAIQQLHEEEAKYTQESGDDASQHKQLLVDLETKVSSYETTAEKFEIKFADMNKKLSQIRLGIQNMFEKLECNTSAMSELLTDTQVTEANTMQFLGIIEQRANEDSPDVGVALPKDGRVGRRARRRCLRAASGLVDAAGTRQYPRRGARNAIRT